MPSAIQQDSEFRVLPNSYRYDRRVAAIGMDCQPRLQRLGERLVVRTETVPVSTGPRIVPREVRDGAPRIDALAGADCGLSILRTILIAMRDYDAGSWQAKVDDGSKKIATGRIDEQQVWREIESSSWACVYWKGSNVGRHFA